MYLPVHHPEYTVTLGANPDPHREKVLLALWWRIAASECYNLPKLAVITQCLKPHIKFMSLDLLSLQLRSKEHILVDKIWCDL